MGRVHGDTWGLGNGLGAPSSSGKKASMLGNAGVRLGNAGVRIDTNDEEVDGEDMMDVDDHGGNGLNNGDDSDSEGDGFGM